MTTRTAAPAAAAHTDWLGLGGCVCGVSGAGSGIGAAVAQGLAAVGARVALLEVFDRVAMPVLLQTLGHPLGFWTSHVGPLNQFVHLWGYDSLADHEQRCAARDAHPDFAKDMAASGHLIVAQETRLIKRAQLPSMAGRAP